MLTEPRQFCFRVLCKRYCKGRGRVAFLSNTILINVCAQTKEWLTLFPPSQTVFNYFPLIIWVRFISAVTSKDEIFLLSAAPVTLRQIDLKTQRHFSHPKIPGRNVFLPTCVNLGQSHLLQYTRLIAEGSQIAGWKAWAVRAGWLAVHPEQLKNKMFFCCTVWWRASPQLGTRGVLIKDALRGDSKRRGAVVVGCGRDIANLWWTTLSGCIYHVITAQPRPWTGRCQTPGTSVHPQDILLSSPLPLQSEEERAWNSLHLLRTEWITRKCLILV